MLPESVSAAERQCLEDILESYTVMAQPQEVAPSAPVEEEAEPSAEGPVTTSTKNSKRINFGLLNVSVLLSIIKASSSDFFLLNK